MASSKPGLKPLESHRPPNPAKKDGGELRSEHSQQKTDPRRTEKPVVPKRKEPNYNTPTMDEPLYELPDMVTLIPDQKYNSINLDFSGYLTLCEESYRNLSSVESRLTRQMTLGTFVHVMNEYFWVRIIKLAELFRIPLPFDAERICTMVDSKEAYIPSEIHEYLKNIGQFKDGFGDMWRPNIPDILIPVPTAIGLVGGHFGRPDAENHNIYEMVLAPYTSARRVEIEFRRGEDQFPLPDGIAPIENDVRLQAEMNFVGFYPYIPAAHADATARVQDFHFTRDPIGSRIQHSPELMNVVNSVLQTLESKVKISRGIPENIDGSTSQTSFVVTESDDPLCTLRRGDITICSRSQLTRSELGQSNLFAYRRQRSPATPGYCYRTAQGLNPVGWPDSINNNFNSEGPFAIRDGNEYELLDFRNFGVPGTNNRPIVILDWIRNNFRKKI